MMTLQERLTDANKRSAALYLFRQQLENQAQQIQLQKQQTEFEMVKLDGEIKVLEELLQESENHRNAIGLGTVATGGAMATAGVNPFKVTVAEVMKEVKGNA